MINWEDTEWVNNNLQYGFFEFPFPFLDLTFQALCLFVFFCLFRTKKYIERHTDEQLKQATLAEVKKGGLGMQLFFIALSYMDYIMIFIIYLSGVTKIDFYHICLMYFFVIYAIFPTCFKRHFFFLVVFSAFFVWEKYLYTLIVRDPNAKSWTITFCEIMGFSSTFNDTGEYFRYTPKFQQWIVLFIAYIQY